MLTSKRRVKPVESVTTGLSRNTASSLAKKVVNVPKRALSRKPSMNNMRRKSTVDPVKTPVSPETSQSPEACFKRLSEQTLHDHNCEQTYRHICAGCDRNVAVQETSSSSTSSRQKLKSTSSSSTTATHTEDMSPSKKLKPQEDWIVAPQEEWKSEENKQVWKEEWKPTENKQVEWKSAENKQVEWKSAENKQVEWKFTEIKQENRVELTKDSDQEKRERDEEERWKESFLKQQERMLATLLVHHHHMNDIELMHLQSQVIQLKSHTNTTLDHILDVQSNLLNKVSLLLNPPAPEPLLEPAPLLESVPDWQTKVAFDLARFKWGLNQWFGNLVGIGEMDNQEYDRFGYTNDVVISGIAVTIEPALLPKSFQKFFLNKPTDIICLKYTFRLNRPLRLSNHFRYKEQDEWTDSDQCEFSISIDDEYKHRKVKKQCQVEFGWFQRKHHCRSCGHTFCHVHSSNTLCLFFNKNGQEKGEWSRVCDGCFFERMGIGVDILHLPRLNTLLLRRGKEKLAKRILSKTELSEFNQLKGQHDMYLATRWCVKEAVYKALYPIHKLEWKQVTVVKEAGKPMLLIDQSKRYGIQKAHVSISHDGDYAMAQVILEA